VASLSIIIVNWNSADYLLRCLASIFQEHEAREWEIIVVDNASNDNCEELLRRQFPEVRFLATGVNLGFARANNAGYSISCAESVLFLNPDTEVLGPAVSQLAEYLQDHPQIGAVGPQLLNSDGSPQFSCIQAFPTILNQVLDCEALRRAFPRSKLWGMRPLFDPHCTPAEVDSISGACFMVRRSVFEKAGRFSEEYFMYSDDLDLSYKIRAAGYKIVYLPYCCVTHYGGKSSEQQSSGFADVLQCQSMDYFFRKTRGATYGVAYRSAMAGVAVLRLVAAMCLLPLSAIGGLKWGPTVTLTKWFAILRWAAGQESWAGAIGRRADA